MLTSHAEEQHRFHYWNSRTLYLLDDHLASDGDEYPCTLLDQLIELNARDRDKPILLVVKSLGGSIATMNAVLDYISAISAPVYTQAIGDVASAAATIAAFGAKGHRYISPTARTMIHEPWAMGSGGKCDELEIEAKELKRFREGYFKLMSELTGQELVRIKRDLKKDTWFWPDEAVKYGLCDKVGILPELLNMPTPEVASYMTPSFHEDSTVSHNIKCKNWE